jgi:hypothetical protein
LPFFRVRLAPEAWDSAGRQMDFALCASDAVGEAHPGGADPASRASGTCRINTATNARRSDWLRCSETAGSPQGTFQGFASDSRPPIFGHANAACTGGRCAKSGGSRRHSWRLEIEVSQALALRASNGRRVIHRTLLVHESSCVSLLERLRPCSTTGFSRRFEREHDPRGNEFVIRFAVSEDVSTPN